MLPFFFRKPLDAVTHLWLDNDMTNRTATTSLTDPSYWQNVSDELLAIVVDKYTADSLFMAHTAPALSDEAMAIANTAWMVLASRKAA